MTEVKDRPGLIAIVGIGSSAGGLEACRTFLASLAKDTGMAFVLVQHLDPNHDSVMVELLRKGSPIPVEEATDGAVLRADCLLVMPPNVEIRLTDGVVHLDPRSDGRTGRMPIDGFFHSLAEAHGQKAVGVVLSGTGTDGTLGLRTIKDSGGITFAQDPAEAKFDGMPRSAIQSGCIDMVLPVAEIAAGLKRIATHPYVRPGGNGQELPLNGDGDRDNMNRVFTLLKQSSGVDFTSYKRSTVVRRIARRMVVHRIEALKDYVALLQKMPQEAESLYQDILIKVTRFFRDPDVFEYLKATIFPAMLEHRPHEDPVRIWIPGCATGEEVYSICICLMETMAETAVNAPAQIFATDLSDTALSTAREGRYVENVSRDVSTERLQRFFVKTDGGYQIGKALRDICVFAKQNMTSDPPFSKVDLISCRNVMIYLEPKLQKRVIPLFHYALKSNGVLMLGTSETIGAFNDLFTLQEKRFKIYAKKPSTKRLPVDFDTSYPRESTAAKRTGQNENLALTFAREQADRIVFSKYSAAGVMINDNFDILQFRGKTDEFLAHAPGEPSLNLLRIAREGLALELRTLVHEARQKQFPVVKHGVAVPRDKRAPLTARIEIHPLYSAATKEHFFLVLFEAAGSDAPQSAAASDAGGAIQGSPDRQLDQLRTELEASKGHLQAIIEEQEATNEELQSANEEILSSNEELQSINEELETAKEELQSTNEELTTVNEELQNRNQELSTLNNDLTNVLNSVNIPMVMVSGDLRIRRFTPQAEKLFTLIASDVGRPLADIKTRLELPDLEKLVAEVVDTMTPVEMEVRSRDGRWYSMRIRPYKTRDNKIDGAVVALLDIEVAKRAKLQLEDIAGELIQFAPQPTLIVDSEMEVRALNNGFVKQFGVAHRDAAGKLIHKLSEGFGPLREPLEKLLSGAEKAVEFSMPYKTNGNSRDFSVHAERLRYLTDPTKGFFVVVSFNKNEQ